jgi:hypothetical protein
MTKNDAKKAFLTKGIIDNEVFERFLSEDPTTQKKYVFYMIKEYLKQAKDEGAKINEISLDDLDMGILSQIFSYVTEYNTLLGRVPQDKKDIYKLSFEELANVVDDLNKSTDGDDKSSLRKKARANSDNFNELGIVDVPGVSVVAPYNHDAICYYGQGTRWCVAMDTSSHWMGYYFNQNYTFYIISATSDAVRNKIKQHYQDKWEKMGLGKSAMINNKKRKWTLVKDGKDIADIAAIDKEEAAELFKERLKLPSLRGYDIENYGYRNLYKVAFLVPPLKDRNGVIVRDEENNPLPNLSDAHIYSSDDVSFNRDWKEYFKVIGLDDFIE